MNDNHLDGNALAGPLSDVFAFDVTTMSGQCDSCDDVAFLAQALVYGLPMGHVVRCRICDNVLAVLVDRSPHRRLTLRGLRWMDVSGAS